MYSFEHTAREKHYRECNQEWVNRIDKIINRIKAITLPSEHRITRILANEWFNIKESIK